MGTLGIVVAVVMVGFFGLTIGLQFMIRARANALKGATLPELPGGIGEKIASSKRALVYFFSPQCGACRAITPRVRELQKKNASVFAIDVMQNMEIARALRVMATPSTVEIDAGRIAGYHIGAIPEEVMARFR